MTVKQTLLNYAADGLLEVLMGIPEKDLEEAEEVRLRIGRPIIINHHGGEFSVSAAGRPVTDIRQGFCPNRSHIAKCVALISGYSLYAFEESLRSGYLTLPGGYRVGVTGKTVIDEQGVKTLKHINGLNFRIGREVKGCADAVLPLIADDEQVRHTLIISPPGCGKTTLLRDIIRRLSDGTHGHMAGQTVAVADERSEIAGCYLGVPQKDVGLRTDVLDGCPKADGMMMLLRSMSPKIIAVDEIGKSDDITAIEEVINGGVTLLCTVHGRDVADLQKRATLAVLLSKNIFSRFVVLRKHGEVAGVYDERYNQVDKGGGERHVG